MSSLSANLIELRFIRNTSSSEDDRIIIRKNLDTNDYNLTYMDPNEGNPITHKLKGLYRQQVVDHMYLLLKNQYIDEEGFEQIQFSMPAMPRLIVAASQLREVYYRDHFCELVSNSLDLLGNGPAIQSPLPASSPLHSQLRQTLYETPTIPKLRKTVSAREVERRRSPRLACSREDCCADSPSAFTPIAQGLPQHLFFDE